MKTEAFTKTYAGRRVLELPELEIVPGAVTAVIGANGSGKSTMARVIAGMEAADGNRRVLPSVRIGFLPQKPFAFRLNVEQNLALNGGDEARRAKLLEALGLTSLRRSRAKRLSGGETAKMALARILLGSYDLLILDEPTAAMDMASTLAAEQLIGDYARETGCAVVLITHSLQQARRLAQQVLYLDAGMLVEQGPAEAVLNEPKEAKTKQFLEFYGI